MEKPKKCNQCTYFIPDIQDDPKSNGECNFLYFRTNARSKACDFGTKKPKYNENE